MTTCPKTLYDNQKGNFIIYNNQKNSNAINYLYQGPRDGLTGFFALNAFRGNYNNNATNTSESFVNNTLPLLPTKGYLAKTSECTDSQDSNSCLQLRRSLRNYNNSVKENKADIIRIIS